MKLLGKILVKLLGALLSLAGLVLVPLLITLYVRYGGGDDFPDRTGEPLMRAAQVLEQVAALPTPPGNIAVSAGGRAVVIDPSLDPRVYIEAAEKRGWMIVASLDTHVHADHLSRARLIEKLTGAPVALPETTRVSFPYQAVRDSDALPLSASVALTATRDECSGHATRSGAPVRGLAARPSRASHAGDCLETSPHGTAVASRAAAGAGV